MTTTTTIKMYLDNGMIITLTTGERKIATTSIQGVTYSGEVLDPAGKSKVEEWMAWSLLKGISMLNLREYRDAINTLTAEMKGLAA